MHSRPVGVPLTEVDSVQEHREDWNVKRLQRLTLVRKWEEIHRDNRMRWGCPSGLRISALTRIS
jgi:hypothetical protein